MTNLYIDFLNIRGRFIHKPLLFISRYMCVYIRVCVSIPRYRQRKIDVQKGKGIKRIKEIMLEIRDINKKDTILYFCSWTCCFDVISVYKSLHYLELVWCNPLFQGSSLKNTN